MRTGGKFNTNTLSSRQRHRPPDEKAKRRKT